MKCLDVRILGYCVPSTCGFVLIPGKLRHRGESRDAPCPFSLASRFSTLRPKRVRTLGKVIRAWTMWWQKVHCSPLHIWESRFKKVPLIWAPVAQGNSCACWLCWSNSENGENLPGDNYFSPNCHSLLLYFVTTTHWVVTRLFELLKKKHIFF